MVFLFLLVTVGTISALINGIGILRWVWALRNWGRFFSFFIACVTILDKNKIDKMLSFFMMFFHLNFVVMLFQYLIFGISGDSANGLIGRDTSSVNLVFILIVTVIVISQFQTKKISTTKFVLLLLEISVANIIGELKGNFIFIVILLLAIYLINSKARGRDILRFLVIVILGCIVLYLGFTQIIKIYPQFSKILTYDGFMEQVNNEHGYGNTGIYDRLNGITVTNKYFFKSNWVFRLFGFGIGNTEYSSFDFLKSSFFNQYGGNYKYLNFSLPIIYLETGLCGLVLFFASHISLLSTVISDIRKKKRIDGYYCNIGAGMLVVAIVFIFYCNLHRTDATFLMAFACSIPFALIYRYKGNYYE